MTWYSKLTEKRFYYLIGLAGVSPLEVPIARRCGSIFSGLMVVVAIILLVEWQWQLLREITAFTSFILNWFVFVFFVVAFVVELLLVKSRWRYIGQNWALPIIILGGLPFLLEYSPLTQPLSALRPLLALYILFPSLKTLISFFFDGHLRTTILGAALVVVIFGILVAGVDPSVKSVWDGIWWAIATVSTIGYGDVVPSSALGRLLGTILVILGVAIFVIITANILAYNLKKEAKQLRKEEKDVEALLGQMKQMKKIQQEQTKLLEELNKKIK
jgi:voltage-gated potassium channel